jgi:hypothetical protein
MVHNKSIKRPRKGSRRKEQRKPKCSLVWRIGQSGVPPDSVRCTREDQLQTLHLRVFQAHLRYNSSDCPVCHWTVWCTSGATVICAQRSTLQSKQYKSDVRAASQRGTGLSGVPPDCPVRHEDKASNGRPAPTLTNRLTWRLTGHCPVRPSPASFSNGHIVFGGYKYHPNRPLQGWESKQHSKSSS